MGCNGALVGLVSISGCCALVPPWVSVLIGTVGGWVYYGGVKLLLHLRIDDAVDAIPAHLGGGTWGLLATGLFANPHYMQVAGYNSAHPGWFYSWARGSGDANLLLCEFCHFLYICTWVTVIMAPTFWILRRMGEFRVDEEDELRGLDHSFHGITQEFPSDRRSYGSDQFRSSFFGSSQFGTSSRGFHYVSENAGIDEETAVKRGESPELADKMVAATETSMKQMADDTVALSHELTEKQESIQLLEQPVVEGATHLLENADAEEKLKLKVDAEEKVKPNVSVERAEKVEIDDTQLGA